MTSSFRPVRPGRLPVLVLTLLGLLPLVLAAIASSLETDPGDRMLALVVVGFAALSVAALVVLMFRQRVELDGEALRVATSFYARRIARADLDPAAARIFDPAEHTEYRPRLKRNGFSLPGYHSGWFSLRGGGKALMAVAGGRRWLHLPTRLGYALVLDLEKPQALLDELRRGRA